MSIVESLFYPYRTLFDGVELAEAELVANRTAEQYSKLTKQWSEEASSEWTCRTYLATKMILNATVLVNSLEFARSMGMRIANPYLEYYAALSAMRAVAYTLPTERWSNGSLMAISHSKAINVSFDWLGKLNKDRAADQKKIALQLRAQRELISYNAPASGDALLGSEYDLTILLTTLLELAQFNSELLERSVTKNASPDSFVVRSNHIDQISKPTIEGYSFIDNEDGYRLDYIRRKMPRPYNLAIFMTKGQTEDFIGAWDGNEADDGAFSNGSPANWQTLFDIP